jgi:coenzyme F420-reducing hydrogenase delta subunit
MAEKPVKIIGFCCQNAVNEKIRAPGGRLSFEPAVRLIFLPCSSKLETLGIVKAFESGADGVFVLGCPEGGCKMMDGNRREKKTVEYTRRLLSETGVDEERLFFFQSGPDRENAVEEAVDAMMKKMNPAKA